MTSTQMAATTPGNGNGAQRRNGREPGISVVVPVYNEEESIPALYQRTSDALEGLGEPWELVFVDDGSRDGSLALLEEISQRDPRVEVVALRRNFGQTAALSAGFDHATGSVIVALDADLQNDPADIPRLLARLDEGYDIVSGWRRDRNDPFLTKILPSHLSNKLISWLTGVQLHDYGCTLKAYRREVLERINLYGEFHRFIPALASAVGARITEIEVTHHSRKFGTSKYGITRILRGFLDVLTLKLLLTYQSRPMQFFGGLGVLFLGLGGLCLTADVLMKLFMAVDMTGNPLLYLAVLALLSGIQLVGLGFIGEINMRTYYETQRKRTYIVQSVRGNGHARLSKRHEQPPAGRMPLTPSQEAP